MGSAIESILDDIAGMSPTYDTDVSIGVWNIDQQKEVLAPASCPKRVLMIIPNGTTADPMTFIALGTTTHVTWLITDRLYLKPSGEMGAYRRYTPETLRYTASYLEAVRQNRGPTAQSHIESVRAYPGIYAYPEGSDQYFYGVDVLLEIEEVISA
jgi:hypothetical protein